ncbi:unnamed protein product [Ranitomeya imitator]|uniref:Uncharacterized protein n=1 Tax=Ranitomeya imitator TaxID=111125 RepID=A0ABN9M862_9NEOB|nr:unnamed protein product [Ranitomeya imitator]
MLSWVGLEPRTPALQGCCANHYATVLPKSRTLSLEENYATVLGLISKVGTAVKEVNAVKSNSIRTVAASPIKSKAVTHKDSTSQLKPPAKQTTRPQSAEKGAQQMASLLVTKNETAKKTAEGVKPTGGQEAGSTTPSKRSGTVKREVGKIPEYGSVPKDKTLCLRPESSASVASKPLATASSPNKTLKASSMSSPKSKQIVPQPEKHVTAISLSTKATKSPLPSTRQGAITSTIAKQVKTASPLAKTPRPTSVLTKVAKTPTSPVKPVNTSAPVMSRSATPVKPPGNTLSATNQAKVGKRSITNKATPVSAKQVNHVPTAIKSVKSSTVDSKSVKLDSTEATTVKEVNQNLPEVAKVKMNATEKIAKLDKPQESPIIENEMAALPVNIVRETTTVDDAMNGGKHLESKLPLDRNESISLTEKNLVENHSQDKETQLLPSLTPEVKSLAKQFIPLEEEVSDLVKEESSTELNNPLYEGQKSKKPFEDPLNVPSKHIQESLSAPETHFIKEETKPFKEETSDFSEQEELGSNTELAINSDNSDNVHGKVHILNKSVSDELASSIQPSKTVEFLSKENRSLDKDQMVEVDEVTYLKQLERMPMQSLDEETFTVECAEPLEDAITSSLEQVTPLEEGILSEDELEHMEQKYTMLKVEQRNSPEISDKLETSPGEPHNPLDVITSSTEELTPSEEEAVLLKHEKQMVQEISSSENLDMENVTSKIDVAKTTEIATLSVEPIIYANEKVNTLEEPFGETIINAEGKHTEKGNIQSSDLLQSSAEEIRISEELMSEEPLHSSFNDNITQWEDSTSAEAMQTSVEEVKLSEKEPLLSVESVEYSVETVKSPHEDQIFSVEPLQDVLGDIKSSQEEAMSTVEPCQTSGDKVKHLQDCLLMETLQSSVEDVFSPPKNLSSPLLLNASFEPLNPLEENLLSSFDKLTEPKESITSMEGISRLERSQSPVQLQDLNQHLVSLENTKELANELREDDHNVSSEKEEIPLMPQGHLIEQFNSIIQPSQHDAEIFDASFVKSSENVEHSIKSANIDPVGSELFEEPSNMIYDPDHGTPEHVNAEEKLDSVEAGVEYICNPIKLGQSVLKSVLLLEETSTSIEEFKTTSVEATASPEKPIKSLLERVSCVDNVEKSTKPSIHELMCYNEDLTTSLEKSMDIPMFTPSEDIGVCSSDPVDITTNVPTLLNYLEHLEKFESNIPLTVEDNAFVETSVEPQLNKPSIHVLTPLDSLER